jgi:hypothetical protein
MAGKKAGFITGANAKIKMFGETVAFATDVSYDVTVDNVPVEAMGRYEVFSYEPVGYRIAGSLSIIRYTGRAATSTIDDVVGTGNHPSEIGDGAGSNAKQHLNPAELLVSETFDLDIFEQTGGANDNQVFRIKDCRLSRRGMTLNKRGVMTDRFSFVGILGGDLAADAIDVAGSGYGDLS